MTTTNIKNINAKIILTCIAIVTIFIFTEFSNNEMFVFNENEELYNPLFEDLPEKYIQLINKKPIDSVVHKKKEKLYNSLKFNSHFMDNEMYQELILIKRVDSANLLKTNSLRFDIYPTNKINDKKKYFTLESNSIIYRYNNENYQVVRQVVPSIEIVKIVPYTRFWQSLINEINNEAYTNQKDADLTIGNKLKTDSMSFSNLNIETSVFDYLFKKELEKNKISYWLPQKGAKKEEVLAKPKKFISSLNNQNLRLIKISNDISFWNRITKLKQVTKVDYLNGIERKFEVQLKSYIDGEVSFSEVFDVDKLSKYYGLLNLYTNRLENSFFLIYNKDSKLYEPYHVDKKLGKLNTYVKSLEIFDKDFQESYAKQLNAIIISRNVEVLVHENKEDIRVMLNMIHQRLPLEIFDENIFYHNKLIIEKALKASTIAKIDLVSYSNNLIEVEIENWGNFPIKITELSFKNQKYIASPIEELVIIPYMKKTRVAFSLPRSFDNLFVHKKKKVTGFIFEKDIFKLNVGYKVLGTNKILYEKIVPFRSLDNISKEDDLFRSNENFVKFNFLDIDQENKLITFNRDSILISEPLILPKGYTVIAKGGLNIDIVNGGKIISKSSLNFIGTEGNHIKIYSSDGKGQGLLVLSTKQVSELKYVEFKDLTNPSHGLWDVSGAVTFYESPVNFDYVFVENNSCEDAVNIIRTDFTMTNTIFKNTQSDAFDGDFVTGQISNCEFRNLGNDAIDVSGSKLKLDNLIIFGAGDKGISAGENSIINAEKIKIKNSEIAITGKDLSKININNVNIINSKLGFAAFQKKPEFGPSQIIATNIITNQVNTLHLIEDKSSLKLNGKIVETVKEVKNKMYGIEFGIDSKETRTKKE